MMIPWDMISSCASSVEDNAVSRSEAKEASTVSSSGIDQNRCSSVRTAEDNITRSYVRARGYAQLASWCASLTIDGL